MVDQISIEFPGHVSKNDLSALVVELIEHILFMRGQFPFRLEEGKKYVNELQRRHDWTKKGSSGLCWDSSFQKNEGIIVAENKENQDCQKISPKLKKAKEQLVQSVQNFESYLLKLSSLLCKHEVREVVLNFGKNFRMPKELFHIKLPGKCFCSDYSKKTLPFQKCKRHLFRKFFENQVNCKDLPSEDLLSVSVMLKTLGMAITDDMEQKPFYSVPIRQRLCVIELNFKCEHCCADLTKSLENNDCNSAGNTCKFRMDEEASSGLQSDCVQSLWVQLMPVLKGFRDNFTQERPTVL